MKVSIKECEYIKHRKLIALVYLFDTPKWDWYALNYIQKLKAGHNYSFVETARRSHLFRVTAFNLRRL
jgi:hypothetical protein